MEIFLWHVLGYVVLMGACGVIALLVDCTSRGDIVYCFKHNPLGTSWRILVCPIVVPLFIVGYVCMGLSQFVAHGKWRVN